MRLHSLFATLLLTASLSLVLGSSAQGEVIADLRGDFVAGKAVGDTTRSGRHADGLPDTTGQGRWNYYTSDTLDPKSWNLMLLTWDRTWRSADGDEPSGYVVARSFRRVGSISGDKPAVHDEPAPPKGFCAMHSSSAPGAAVAEWTSQTSGPVTVAGAIRMAQKNRESGVQYVVFKKGADGAVTPLVNVMTIVDADNHPYKAHTTIAPGDRIYFVLGSNGSIWADHSHVAAAITRACKSTPKSAVAAPQSESQAGKPKDAEAKPEAAESRESDTGTRTQRRLFFRRSR